MMNLREKIMTAAGNLSGRQKILLGVGATCVALLALAFGSLGGLTDGDAGMLTHTAKRGDLVVDAVEAGSIEASESEIIRSEVEGMTTIIAIVPEGTVISEKEIEEGLILVELDSSKLRDKEVNQEITVQSGLAQLAEAQASYEIRLDRNESNFNKAELKLKFAEMDFARYLGSELAAPYMEGELELRTLLGSELLGGGALQKKRELESEIDLAKEEVVRAVVRLDWTKKLFEKGYVTRDDMQADELALKRRQVSREKAETSLRLFERYEFEKETEKLRSDYAETGLELNRVVAQNRAELSRAAAKLQSTRVSYKNKVGQLEKIREEIEKCTIRASKPGMVIYGGVSHRWQNDKIELGKQVREQEEIIKIPNTASMIVRASVHESIIARVKQGLKATIKVDSLPDMDFEGEVKKVAVLPDSQSSWLNPNLKVYETDVSVFGEHPDLKPGMSAEVRIIIRELKGVLLIPVQAVVTRGGERICLVKTALGAQVRPIETGEYNDRFIEVVSGLEEGEQVVLNARDFL
jgi:HlyD family secretion protein